MLNFIGTGSAHNPKLGNNGAYVKSPSGKKLFMIDCGELTFGRLNTYGILDGVEDVYVLITHFHSDHVGSLGSLASYLYYMKEPFESRLTIYTPKPTGLHAFLKATGVSPAWYNEGRLDGDGTRNLIDMGGDAGRIFTTPIAVQHAKAQDCYGYFLEFVDLSKMRGQRIYYSGDSKMIPEQAIMELKSGALHRLYQDTSTHDHEDSVHLSLKQLDDRIPKVAPLRDKVWCMHLDKFWDASAAQELGFQTVELPNSLE